MIDFELFKKLIFAIKNHDEKLHNISNFLQNEICTDSFCYANVGCELQDLLIEILKKYFNIIDEKYDDILTWWLYEDVKKILYNSDGTIFKDITDIKDFYDYLVENKDKN